MKHPAIPDIGVKICGIRNNDDLRACIAAGANYVGLNFHPPSPRWIDIARAANIALDTPSAVSLVGLVVDADHDWIEQMLAEVPLDYLQCHGHESPAEIAALKERFDLPVIKAIAIGDNADLRMAAPYYPVADMLLFDAKPPANIACLPGGNGLVFDWHILAEYHCPLPWFLAGGLTPDNVTAAIRQSGTRYVDTASGVEIRPGVKDAEKIAGFVAAARS